MRKIFASLAACAALAASSSASAATYLWTTGNDFDDASQSIASIFANQFSWSGDGIAHSHGSAMTYTIDLQVDGSFQTIFSETLTNTQRTLASLGTITFAGGNVTAVRLTSNPNQSQSFHAMTGDSFALNSVTVGGPVPEPATWAMMIGGFGLAGAVLRRRTAATAAS